MVLFAGFYIDIKTQTRFDTVAPEITGDRGGHLAVKTACESNMIIGNDKSGTGVVPTPSCTGNIHFRPGMEFNTIAF